MIRIGDYWGRKYDYLKNTFSYIKFKGLIGVKLVNWRKSVEAISDPFMYIQEGFIPSPGEVILDIGSQFGDYALIWEKKFGCRVYSFEISYENFTILKKNLEINRSGIKAYNLAVGNGDEIEFVFDGSMFKKEDNGKPVRTVRLDEWVRENDVTPETLKIDVEGAEYEVLQGAEETISAVRPKIILETHSRSLRDKCDRFLREKGYSLVNQGRTIYSKTGYMDEVTNLFYLPN
jgi:FkbM family methyltransferase